MRKPAGMILITLFLFLTVWPPPLIADEAMVKYSNAQVRLYTDIGAKNAAKVMEDIEFFVEYIEGFFQRYKMAQKKGNPIRCRLFASTEVFNDWVRKADMGIQAGAYFSPGDNCIMAPYRNGEPLAMATLMHECAHQIIHRYINNPPRWIDEGLASYFEGIEFDAYRNVISDCGNFSGFKAMRRLIARDRFVDWDFFFDDARRTRWWDEARRGEFNVGDFYTQSWGVVFYYLHAEDGKTRSVFAKLLKGLNTGRERTKLIEQHISRNMQSFKDFFDLDHQRILNLYYQAANLYKRKQYEKTLDPIISIIEEDPHHYATIRLGADAMWDWGRYDLSIEFWQDLRAKDKKEVLYHWKISRCLIEIGKAQNDKAILEEALAEAKASVRASKKKNPHCLAAQAMAHFELGEVREALATMRSAIRFKCEEREMYVALEKEYSEALRIGD